MSSKFDQIHSLSDKLGNNWALGVATDGERGWSLVRGVDAGWSEGADKYQNTNTNTQIHKYNI